MWSPATGAQPSLVGPIRDSWQRSGFENGVMGYPTSGIICGLKEGGCFRLPGRVRHLVAFLGRRCSAQSDHSAIFGSSRGLKTGRWATRPLIRSAASRTAAASEITRPAP